MGSQPARANRRLIPEPMRGGAESRSAPAGIRRLGAGFVLALMAGGCLVLWIGVPIASMWLASKLTDSSGSHMPIALVLAISGMLVTAIALAWINNLYLRITGGEVRRFGGHSIRRRGPLEPMLAACFAAAAVGLLLWFFVLAENPTVGVY